MKLFCLLIITLFCSKAFCTSDTLSRSLLALGDSYTIGESVQPNERFPAQAAELLNQKGIKVTEVEYIARTGWTTADLQDAISHSKLKDHYDIVTLLIGVNDQFQGLDIDGYRKRFTALLNKAIELAGNREHVIVLSIPDYSVTPFGGGSKKISNEIDQFNSVNKEITLSNHIRYVDITPISRLAATDQSLTANDGLHPSAKQYKLWAEKLIEVIK